MEGRNKPFTAFERSFIVKLIKQQYDIIQNKNIDTVSIHKKNAAWERIAEEYNSSTKITRNVDVKQLKKFWANLKIRESKLKENLRNSNVINGSFAVPEMETENTEFVSTGPHLLTDVKIIASDSVLCAQDDDDSQFWSPIKRKEESQDDRVQGLSDTADPSEFLYGNKRQHTDHPTVENIKIRILEQDYRNQAIKFEEELKHLKKLHEIEVKLKEKELSHKIRMFDLYEEEFKLRIEKQKID